MKQVSWCLKQKKGIELISLKPHLAVQYMKEADETLENVFVTKKKWKVITSYYSCYNAFYAILMYCGIKCEIHDCTLSLLPFFGFDNDEINFFRDLKDKRIQSQYYLKETKIPGEIDIKKFVLKCKFVLNSLSSKDIEEIRNRINLVGEEQAL